MISTFNAVLFLEIQLRGPRPGTSSSERRVYSTKLARAGWGPDDYTCHLEHRVNIGVSMRVSSHDLILEGHDPETNTATYRESVKGSETWYEKLGRFGWVRRPDLEREGP